MGDYGDMREFTMPDSADLLRAGRGLEALQRVKDQMPAWQLMARIWPGQFREAVAHQLMNMSMALLATHRDSEALAAAEEAVAIYRSLAVARPGKSAPGLATALGLPQAKRPSNANRNLHKSKGAGLVVTAPAYLCFVPECA